MLNKKETTRSSSGTQCYRDRRRGLTASWWVAVASCQTIEALTNPGDRTTPLILPPGRLTCDTTQLSLGVRHRNSVLDRKPKRSSALRVSSFRRG